MNNKQTYIKAIEEEIDSAILLYNDIDSIDKCKKKVFELMEQYAQTKVLEALEIEHLNQNKNKHDQNKEI